MNEATHDDSRERETEEEASRGADDKNGGDKNGDDQPKNGDEGDSESKHSGQDESNGKSGGMKRKRKILMIVLACVFLLGGLIYLLLWLFIFSHQESTDDAYVQGNQVTISSQVPGTVIAVLADNTDRVKAGQVLVRLDPTDARVKLEKARSALAQAVRKVRQMQAGAEQLDAAVATRELELGRARADLKRRQPLLAEHAIAPEQLEHARDAVRTAEQALELAQRQAAAAHALVDGSDIGHNPAVLQARAAFRQAWVADRRNAILAPVNGYVAQRSVQVGSSIQAGQQLMDVVPLYDLWVDANFKEDQLADIRLGQPVEVEPDIYGGDIVYHGHVAGIAAGSGSAFALLPAQNATGNWIKVVQRVPVRIRLDHDELRKHPLRVGLSAPVTIDVSDTSGAVLEQTSVRKPTAQTDVYQRNLERAENEADAIIRANLGDSVSQNPKPRTQAR